jgi:hypothetical protein
MYTLFGCLVTFNVRPHVGHLFPWLPVFFFETKLFRVAMQARRMVCCCGLLVGHGVGHYAPSIHLEDLDFSIALSLESHRHLRISIIDSIVGEFSAVLLTFSFVIRFYAISHIVHLQLLRRQL